MIEDLRDAALRAFLWQTVETRAKAMKDAARAELKALPVGERVTAKWGGQILAKAAMNKGSAKLVVTDERAFLNWVAGHHPTEIVSQINPAFVKHIEQRAREYGTPIDTLGEVIPGVELRVSDPSVSVRKEPDVDALAVVAELLSGGHFRLDGTRALGAASD